MALRHFPVTRFHQELMPPLGVPLDIVKAFVSTISEIHVGHVFVRTMIDVCLSLS